MPCTGAKEKPPSKDKDKKKSKKDKKVKDQGKFQQLPSMLRAVDSFADGINFFHWQYGRRKERAQN